jgi:hypothetical protein
MLADEGNTLGELLYNANIDGWTPSKFHELCDGRGPTITLLRVYDNNHWIGGFTSKSWTSEDDLLYDEHAYLFNLTIAEKFSVLDPTAAVNSSHYYGPNFGLGDL